MRVCMLVRGDVRELPPAVYMAEALAGEGAEVDLFTARPATEPTPIDRNGVRYITLPFDWRRRIPLPLRPIRESLLGLSFLRSAGRRSYDLYYAHNMTALPWIPLAAQNEGRPFVYQAHEFATCGECTPLLKLYYLAEFATARRAAQVICPEPHRARIMRATHRLAVAPSVVRNAMPLKGRVESTSLRDLLRSKGRGKGRIVLYQGGYGLTPTFRALLQSLPLWPEEDDLVCVGWTKPDEERRIAEEVAELGVAPRVLFHPAVSHAELWPLVCSADVGLVLYGTATRNEKYAAPNKLGEYLMAGLPVVYTKCPGLESLLGRRPFAASVSGVSPAEFAEALSRFSAGRALAAARAAARAFAESEYHYSAQAATVLPEIRSLCG